MNLLKQIAWYIVPEAALWVFQEIKDYVKKRKNNANNNDKDQLNQQSGQKASREKKG